MASINNSFGEQNLGLSSSSPGLLTNGPGRMCLSYRPYSLGGETLTKMVCSLSIKSWGKFISKYPRSHSSLWGSFLPSHLTGCLHLLQMLPLLETFVVASWELLSESAKHLFCSPQRYQIFILGRWDVLTVFHRLAFKKRKKLPNCF